MAFPRPQVEASVLYSLALHGDGTLYGWGYPAQGTNVLAGWPATPENPRISYIPGQKFKAIAAGNVHALAIRPNGTITGWGNAASGALQPPSHVRFKTVAAGWGFSISQHFYVPNERFKTIAAGGFHVMAITAGRAPAR